MEKIDICGDDFLVIVYVHGVAVVAEKPFSEEEIKMRMSVGEW